MPVVAPLVAVPGVALALIAFVASLFCYVLIVTADQWLRPLLVGLADLIPVIGGYLADGANAVLDFVVGVLNTVSDGLHSFATAWFSGIGQVFEWLSDNLGGFVLEAYSALERLFVHTIPDAISGVVEMASGLVAELAANVAAGYDVLFRGIDELGNAFVAGMELLWRGIDDLGNRIGSLTTWAIDELWSPLDWILNDAIPGVYGELAGLAGKVRDLTDDLGALARRLDDVLPYIVGLAAAIPLAEAISGIRTAARSQRKLDRMCLLDLDEFDELLGLLLAVPTWAIIYKAVEETAENLPEVMDIIEPVLPTNSDNA